MASPLRSEPAQLYKLKYSRIILGIEIAIHVLLLIAIVQLIQDTWLSLFVLLFVLLTIQFFQTQSIIAQFNQAAIEIHGQAHKLIWYDQQGEKVYNLDEIKLVASRWFILLQLGQGKQKFNRLVLADSFVDKTHYTRFRRQLNEIKIC